MGTDHDLRQVEGYSGQPGGGKYVMIRLIVNSGVIAEASYRCNGCAYAHQVSRGLAAFLKGRSLDQASKIEPEDVLAIAGPVPDGKEYYASMAVEALNHAISNQSAQNPSTHDSRLTIHQESEAP